MNRVSTYSPQINNHFCRLTCIDTGQTIRLPSPDIGNSDKLNYTRVNKRTRGGDLIIHREAYWPKSKTFSLQWSHIDYATRNKLILFVKNNLAKLMTYLDHEGNSFTGIITTPDTTFTEDQRNLHTVKLEFETDQ